jgi:hypothetical protein
MIRNFSSTHYTLVSIYIFSSATDDNLANTSLANFTLLWSISSKLRFVFIGCHFTWKDQVGFGPYFMVQSLYNEFCRYLEGNNLLIFAPSLYLIILNILQKQIWVIDELCRLLPPPVGIQGLPNKSEFMEFYFHFSIYFSVYPLSLSLY